MGQRTSKYPPELRERAVRMLAGSGRPIRRVAAGVGIHDEALRLWVRKAEVDGIPAGSRVLPTGVEQELRALRKRNAELERSNQILREASLLFATELDQTGRR
ncbi:MAG: transposase [Actinobacteria bacterium]|nr:transposase [Actinomycetota bacterium]